MLYVEELNLLNALLEKPSDWARYCVLADSMTDHKRDDLARALRWMIKCKRRPQRTRSKRWLWNNPRYIEDDDGLRVYATLPIPVFVLLRHDLNWGEHTKALVASFIYESFYSALLDLDRALTTLEELIRV